jgi:AcrR family transcriptional regulator
MPPPEPRFAPRPARRDPVEVAAQLGVPVGLLLTNARSMPNVATSSAGRSATSPTATRILDAAEALFAARGFAGVSVREIAGQVGLNQASIYNHFEGKQALYEAVLERGLHPILELLGESAAGRGPQGEELLDAVLDRLWQTPHLPKLIQREILDDGEVLEAVAARWLRPIYDQGELAVRATVPPGAWSSEEIPLLIIAAYHLVFGHFISAALARRVAGIDPLTAEVREVHRRFLRRAARRLIEGMETPSAR